VLKPGGHLLAFAGTRTYDLMGISIRMAGFEIRDSIGWIYGSGFPKSLDVSKAIDKGTGENKQRQLRFVNWMRTSGLTANKCDQILKQVGAISPTSSHSIHYFNEGQPQIATADTFDIFRPYLPEVPEEIERLVAERTGIEWTAYKNRQVIGTQVRYNEPSGIVNVGQGQRQLIERKISLSATPEAQQWQGWGTALKPALEPIVVARKPLIGTVAENVLAYGTGGLNIDASRIGTGTGEKKKVNYPDIRGNNYQQGNEAYSDRGTVEREVIDQGRWPANLILDEYTAELLDEQSGDRPGGNYPTQRGGGVATGFGIGKPTEGGARKMNDAGGASRFFYVAKASKRDRNEGLEDLEESIVGSYAGNVANKGNKIGAEPDKPNEPAKNFHPTVKPTELMRYLVKLITPPGGTVLNPFTGSGSTGKAAILEGFDFIGIELTEDYWPIIEGRLKHAEAKVAEAKENIEAQPQGLF
jgi:hypothetical protein